MSVIETGYQNYELYNVTDAGDEAHLELVPLSGGVNKYTCCSIPRT